MQNANGYEWQLNGSEITCDGLAVCQLEYIGNNEQGYWKIAGDDEYRFSTQLNAFYFVMDRCI